MSVKVGVRVRPFNQRQSDLNSKLCVDMIGNMTRLFDAQDPENNKHRDFTFDYSFWSHDEFEPDERGYFVPTGDKYADQQHVFEQVGIEILKNAWEGYHCCLFAYGQTGAGKSYSMVGYGSNKGIVPISCEEIFTRIGQNQDANKEYEVMVSMMEIYNEKVQDLLIPIAKRPKEGHKIREHKTLGIYVEGMSKHFVDTYDSIEKKMEEGGRNRSIAATEMNASSSRAHTIISIEFKQTVVENGKKREKLSVIHLVDLAGSEKVGKTGATGDRLKEAAGINKSLSVLGLVISALADKATGKGNTVVPYRNSCLTRILQNALGGNSKTLMICAISPATDNYDETLSTLRYADQAKKIQNKAVVNESETDKLIRTLTQEREELKEKVMKMEEMFKKLSMGITPEMMEQLNETKQQQRFLDEKMNDYETSKTDKKKQEEQEEVQYANIDLTQPHLSNLNEDPQLSRRVNYALAQAESHIGRRNLDPPNHIEIGGMGIRKLHALILRSQEGEYSIRPVSDGEESNCYLNGDLLSGETPLMNLDRLSFGTNNMFLFVSPGGVSRSQELGEAQLNWDFAQNELYLKKEVIEKQQAEERERKVKEEAEAGVREKEKQLAELQQKLKESEELRRNTEESKQREKLEVERMVRQEQAAKLQQEIQKKKEKLRDNQFKFKQNNKEKYYFQRKLLKTLPKCIEINLIAKEFKKNISMNVKMLLSDAEDDDTDIEIRKRSIMIKVNNKDAGYCYWWDPETLSNRYYIIKDMSEQYFQTGNVPLLEQANDPFWDPPSPALIGRSFLTTKALTYMFDNPANLPIIGQDEQCGELSVNLVPTDQTGTRNLCAEMDDEQVEFEPQQLLDKPFHFLIQIDEASIPQGRYSKMHVEYSFKVNEFVKETFRTAEIADPTPNPHFNYSQLHRFSLVNQQLLDYLTTAKLIFKVYGCEVIEQERKKEAPKPKPIEEKVQPHPTPKTTPSSPNPQQPSPPPKQPQNVERTAMGVEGGAAKKPKKAEAARKDESGGKSGVKVNNKINERDLKNPKEKDCIIY